MSLFGSIKESVSAKIDLRLINFRQNLRDIRAFSWSTALTENMTIMSIR